MKGGSSVYSTVPSRRRKTLTCSTPRDSSSRPGSSICTRIYVNRARSIKRRSQRAHRRGRRRLGHHMCDANTDPATTIPPSHVSSSNKDRRESRERFPIGAITKARGGKELAEMGEMKNRHRGRFGRRAPGANLRHDAARDGVCAWFRSDGGRSCQDQSLSAGGVIHKDAVVDFGLRGMPAAARMLTCSGLRVARLTGAKVHIATSRRVAHRSSPAAKNDGHR